MQTDHLIVRQLKILIEASLIAQSIIDAKIINCSSVQETTYPNRADSSAVVAVGILFLSLKQNGAEIITQSALAA